MTLTLEERIAAIEDRNRRVEAEKGWETSGTRRVAITVCTYFVMVLVFFAISAERPLINAIIPTLGFLLSTLSLPLIKKRWMAKAVERSTKGEEA